MSAETLYLSNELIPGVLAGVSPVRDSFVLSYLLDSVASTHFLLTLRFPWFETPVVPPDFYASARNTSTSLVNPT